MKTIEYLSPSSINKWTENKDEFYLIYLANNRPPRLPQNKHMAVGSSFDAYVKSYLHQGLFGKGKDPRFDLKTLFDAQVEEHNRDAAWPAGALCFQEYQKCGALSDLMIELSKAVGEPRFEIEVKGVVNGYREGVTRTHQGVTLLGKPDVFFINHGGCHVILDFKVNGYYTQASPAKGYINIRNDKRKTGWHDECHPVEYMGMKINGASTLETIKEDWARQLAIYSWLCGEEIGGQFVAAIDQIACRNGDIRVAQHRSKIGTEYQWDLFARIQNIWEIVHSDHIFRDMSPGDSKSRCELLDHQCKMIMESADSRDKWFSEVTRGG